MKRPLFEPHKNKQLSKKSKRKFSSKSLFQDSLMRWRIKGKDNLYFLQSRLFFPNWKVSHPERDIAGIKGGTKEEAYQSVTAVQVDLTKSIIKNFLNSIAMSILGKKSLWNILRRKLQWQLKRYWGWLRQRQWEKFRVHWFP